MSDHPRAPYGARETPHQHAAPALPPLADPLAGMAHRSMSDQAELMAQWGTLDQPAPAWARRWWESWGDHDTSLPDDEE